MGLFYRCVKLEHLAKPLWKLGHTPKCDWLTATYFLVICHFPGCLHEDICDCTIHWSVDALYLPQLKYKITNPGTFPPLPFYVAESDCPWWTAERHRAWLFPPQHCFSSIPQALLPPHLSSSPKMLLARRAEWGHSSAMWQFQWSVSFYDTWKFSWLCEDSFADIIIYNFS